MWPIDISKMIESLRKTKYYDYPIQMITPVPFTCYILIQYSSGDRLYYDYNNDTLFIKGENKNDDIN